MKPTEGKGMPTPGGYTFQDQYSDTGKQALHMHQAFLLPVIVGITILVFFLLLFVIARFNRRANPVPSKTTHNTLIEVIWTLVPVIILVLISVRSFHLLYEGDVVPANPDLTVKAIGHQWYWSYEYPDNGGFTFDAATGRVAIVSCIDNLLKGAATQAVQNMNLMFGLPETMGLEQVSVVP